MAWAVGAWGRTFLDYIPTGLYGVRTMSVSQAHDRLVVHQLHEELTGPARERVFMEHDVFAVWASGTGEFERYLAAMDAARANRGPFDGFLERMAAGEDALDAIESGDIPATVRDFVTQALRLSRDWEPDELPAALCADDPLRRLEAEYAAVEAIEARSRLWDGVVADIRRREAERYMARSAASV